MKKKINKKAVSPVVATILLVLISIMAVAIIAAVIIPFIENMLEGGASCVDMLDKVRVQEESCYDESVPEVRVRIHMGDVELDEIVVALNLEDERRIYSLKDGEDGVGIQMYGSPAQPIVLPAKGGGEKTYVITDIGATDKPKSVDVHPVVNKKICDRIKDSVELSACP